LQEQITNESITFPSGYRMCLLKTNVGINRSTINTFDYLPTSNYTTMAKDKNKSFATTVLKTAQLAVREATLYEQSTYSLLDNAELINRDLASQEKWLQNIIGYEHKDSRYWNEAVFRGDGSFKIFDITAESKAFWRINQQSGEMYGILPDGSGGGGDRFKTQLEELSLVINIYITGIRIAGLGSTPIGIVAHYGKTLVKLYAIVCEVIIVMDATGMDEAIKAAMKEFACNVAKEITYGLSGNSGKIMRGLDNLIGLIVGNDKNPFSC